ADVNAQGGHYGTALQAVSWAGSEQLTTLLLNHNADVNTQGGYFGYALLAASWAGHNSMIGRLLFAEGADINAQGGYFGDALQAASCVGNDSMVQLLIRQGADVNAQVHGGRYGTALWAASIGSHWHVMGRLRRRKNTWKI
ncbi:ankyrin, partial [Ophiobolus disseminans]